MVLHQGIGKMLFHCLTEEAHGRQQLNRIEGLIAESVVPIARHGTFAGVPGASFLSMVREKVRWIRKHASRIAGLIAD